jgi:SAM-dependent methyltransferase
LAHDYQRRSELFPGWREVLVARLAPQPGDTVLDLGCGTGLNLAALRAAVGPGGMIVAVDERAELLAVAAARAARRRFTNVELICAPIQTATASVRADAALFAVAPEVLVSGAALASVFARLRPGARVAAGGWTLPPRWLWPFRTAVTMLAGPLAAGCAQPWRPLAEQIPDLHLTQFWLHTGYLAHGHTRATPSRWRS